MVISWENSRQRVSLRVMVENSLRRRTLQQQNLLRLEEFGSQGSDTFVAYEFVGFADLGKLKAGLDLLGDEDPFADLVRANASR